MKYSRKIASLLAGSGIILLFFHDVLNKLRDSARDEIENIRESRVDSCITRFEHCKSVNNTYVRKDVDVRIIVMSYNRPRSVMRLLNSLNQVHYDDAKVVVEIWLDRATSGWYSNETESLARNFEFHYGFCDIHVHDQHVGIRGQWLDVSME